VADVLILVPVMLVLVQICTAVKRRFRQSAGGKWPVAGG
jgi:hypothetical protein